MTVLMIIIPAGVLNKQIKDYFFEIFTSQLLVIMGNNTQNKSRRSFFTGLLKPAKEKIKLLTADGKLVEVDKEVLEAAKKQKVNNKDILQWMNNPSKSDSRI